MQTNTQIQTFKHTMLYALCSIALLMSSCRGDDGPMGPRGPQGLDGPKGDPGDIAYSIQFEVLPSDWTGDANGYYAYLPAAEITSAIYNNGAVLVYLLNEEDTNNMYFNMLPFTSVDNNSITYMDFNVYVGEIELILKWIDNGVNVTEAPGANYAFKVIIMEGTDITTLKNEVNIYNFNAVSNYLGLKDNAVIMKSIRSAK